MTIHPDGAAQPARARTAPKPQGLGQAWRRPWRQALLLLLALSGLWGWPLLPAQALAPSAVAAAPSAGASYRCDGDLLHLSYGTGAVDAPDIPNLLAGTAPGAFVLIDWRGLHLQLPRTNNAGAPSYSDGRWWWRAANPQQPELRQRRGVLISYACEPAD